MRLSCQNLTVSLGGRVIIPSLDFQQDTPALVGLLGGNGAGKTTLLRALAGLESPDSGSIVINDHPVGQTSAQTLAQHLAYLPQHREVHWALSVYEVIMLGRMPYQRAFYPPTDQDHTVVRAVMQRMDVEGFAERGFHQLSGGEQARVLLARALAQEPSVLLADEPANGLDPAHQIAMMQAFQSIVERGCTVIVALHDLNLAARYCDRVVLLEDGKIFRDGPPDTIITRDNLKLLFGVEAQVLSVDGRLSVCVTG